MQRTFIITLLILTLSGLVFGQATTNANSKDEQEVLKAVDEVITALLKKDVAVIERVYADNYIVTFTGGNTSNKERWLAGFKASKAGYDAWDKEETKVLMYGNAAVVSSRFKVKGHNNSGQSYTADWRCTATWVKQKGSWQLVMTHFSDIKPPAPPAPAQ